MKTAYLTKERILEISLLIFFTIITIFIGTRLISLKDYSYVVYSGTYPQYIYDSVDAEIDFTDFSVLPNKDGRDPKFIFAKDKEFTIQYGSEEISFVSKGDSLQKIFRKYNIVPADNEFVLFDVTGETTKISVVSEFVYTTEVEHKTSYTSISETNPYYIAGTTHVKQQGQNGSITYTYDHLFDINGYVSTELVSQTPDTAIQEIIEIGTGQRGSYSVPTIVSDVPNGDGSGTITLSDGEVLTYSKVEICVATAYSGGGTTSIGYQAQYGNIAVDPSYIPYRSRMYIQSTDGAFIYGLATACDTGAFSGNRIDLYYNTYDECIQFGRRSCAVYILN